CRRGWGCTSRREDVAARRGEPSASRTVAGLRPNHGPRPVRIGYVCPGRTRPHLPGLPSAVAGPLQRALHSRHPLTMRAWGGPEAPQAGAGDRKHVEGPAVHPRPSVRPLALVTMFFLATTIFYTYPLVPRLATAIMPGVGDYPSETALIAWSGRHVLPNPARLF